MGAFSEYIKNKILDHVFSCGSGLKVYTPPQMIYVALSKTDPLVIGLTEPPTGDGYSRVATDSSFWDDASDGFVRNSAQIVFGPATKYWGVISHFAILDSASGGNILFAGGISEKFVEEGDMLVFNKYNLRFRLV